MIVFWQAEFWAMCEILQNSGSCWGSILNSIEMWCGNFYTSGGLWKVIYWNYKHQFDLPLPLCDVRLCYLVLRPFSIFPANFQPFQVDPKPRKQRSKDCQPLRCLLRMQISSERIGSMRPQKRSSIVAPRIRRRTTASSSPKACQYFVKRHMLSSRQSPRVRRQKAETGDSNENNIVLHSLYLYLWRSTKGFLENA